MAKNVINLNGVWSLLLGILLGKAFTGKMGLASAVSVVGAYLST